jgi:hypothetical protein
MKLRALVLALLAVCATCRLPRQSPPGPLTAAEQAQFGIDGGVVGRVDYLHGNCMPGCVGVCGQLGVPENIAVEAIPTTADAAIDAGLDECGFDLGRGGVQRETLGGPANASLKLSRDSFALAVPPGDYYLALVDRFGCARCFTWPCAAVRIDANQTVSVYAFFDQVAE